MDGCDAEQYLRYDLLGGARGWRAERRRGAVGRAGAEAAGPPREARGPRGERRHGGSPLQHHEGQHRRRGAAAAGLGLVHEAGEQRGGVREREPVREEAVEDAAQRGRPRRGHLRRQLQEIHLQRQRGHLRRRAQIRRRRRLHHPVPYVLGLGALSCAADPAPARDPVRRRGASWRRLVETEGEAERVGVARRGGGGG